MEELTRLLTALTETVRREHDRAAHREEVIDRLHTENQRLRHGLLEEALTPVRAGLYRLHDTAAREAARWQASDPPPAALAGPLLSALADDVAEVLGRTGAERVGVKPGDAYDPAVHRPVETRTVDADADGTVVEVLVDGFAQGERVLRKASVVVGRAVTDGKDDDDEESE
ncbi:nucleotide exchange factor GrpE [Sphaerisporangium fuscum]|uniref:nucleotide exchange factor GrpE n=1 Tax=Sphaerisporangium fuscum TaxID=2835868 RepID=UPI0027E3A101|nr:nucleotide exchange factor GrpE [Sphaerisporangium fuscum]